MTGRARAEVQAAMAGAKGMLRQKAATRLEAKMPRRSEQAGPTTFSRWLEEQDGGWQSVNGDGSIGQSAGRFGRCSTGKRNGEPFWQVSRSSSSCVCVCVSNLTRSASA